MSFCINCGEKLSEGAKFCAYCGTPVYVEGKQQSKQRVVYEGEVHKCPNCGEVLSTFLTHCPTCRYEIRDRKSTTAVREFAWNLGMIEAQRMTVVEEKKSFMKMLLGKDFEDSDEAQEAVMRFERDKAKQKASLIVNFAVPNTREDILEFMFLATSNINVKTGIDDSVSKAWISKLDQVYKKAELSMRDHPDFEQIRTLYEQKKDEIKKKKIKEFLKILGAFIFFIFSMGLLIDSKKTIIISICVVVMLCICGIGFVYNKKRRN